jgi:hypothetical protein
MNRTLWLLLEHSLSTTKLFSVVSIRFKQLYMASMGHNTGTSKDKMYSSADGLLIDFVHKNNGKKTEK